MASELAVRVMFAWELGDNHGHLLRHVQVARALRRRGHPVLFAVRNTTIARATLARHSFHFVQAPIYQARPKELSPTITYADILLNSGYGDADELDGLLRSWITILSLYKPDLLVADHAPTAVLAARVLNIRTMLVGTGFEIPPAANPFPSFVSWRPVDPTELARNSEHVFKSINQCLRWQRAEPLPDLSKLFSSSQALVTSIKELDPYGPRSGVRYVGVIGSPAGGSPQKWSSTPGAKLFAYLHNDLGQLGPLIQALRNIDAEAICVLPHVPKESLPPPNEKMRFFNQLLDIDEILPKASLCISNGGNGLAGRCLELGVPMLHLPIYLEQYVTAHHVAKLGSGMVISGPLSVVQYASVIQKALQLRLSKAIGDGNAVAQYQAAINAELGVLGA